MTKRVNILPNLRIDTEDLEAATHGFTGDSFKQHWDKFILDNISRVSDGFRVEIANQTTSPGLFTVHNGIAFDRYGQIVENEDSLNAARSYTLSVNATFYVEVEFILSESDVDARAFWDPTYDNGTDPSGDERLDGREFSRNVATRLTPDWQIVTPISTSGFQVSSNPNSVRIPVAIITRAAGVITGSTAPLRTTLREDSAAATTTIKVVDSRAMPDTFTATLDVGGTGQETVTVNANDREHGILTLAAGTTNPHTAGARLAVAGATPAQYIPERTTPLPDIGTPAFPSSGTSDTRPRFWQGDEERGYVFKQDPATNTGRGDTQIKALKDYVDFLAGELRELRWGAANSGGLGQGGPPTIPVSPRYFDYASSLMGARAHTVSVGDGTSTWGDYNKNGFLTSGGDTAAKQALQAAVDSLPSTGGVVYVKAGTYPIDVNPVSITKPVILIGDGIQSTLIQGINGTTVFSLGAGADDCQFINTAITQSSVPATESITISANIARLVIKNCVIDGLSNTGFSLSDSYFENIQISPPDQVSSATAVALEVGLVRCMLVNCTIAPGNTAGTAPSIILENGSLNSTFSNCAISSADTSTTNVVRIAGGTTSGIEFENCTFSGGGNNSWAVRNIAGVLDNITFVNCSSTCIEGMFNAAPAAHTNLHFERCKVTFTTAGATRRGILIQNSAATSCRHSVIECAFTETGVRDATNGVGLYVENLGDSFISRNVFTNCDYGIQLAGTSNSGVSIGENKFLNSAGFGRQAIRWASTTMFGNVMKFNVFGGLSDFTSGPVTGIRLTNGGSSRTKIANNEFVDIGNSGIGNCHGILAEQTTGHSELNISENEFTNLNSTSAVVPIWLAGGTGSNYGNTSIMNNTFKNIGNSAGTSVVGVLVSKFAQLNISDNHMFTVGRIIVGVTTKAIHIGSEAAAVADAKDFVISGNTLQNIRGVNTGVASIIQVDNGGNKGTISNNILEIDGFEHVSGISCSAGSPDTSAAETTNIVINGNVIDATISTAIATGIYCLSATADLTQTRFVVSNNIVKNTYSGGIKIDLGGSTSAWPSLVNGNITETNVTTGYIGIEIIDSDVVATTGNVVNMHGAVTSGTGIKYNTVRRGSITGNTVFVNGTVAAVGCISFTSGSLCTGVANGNFCILPAGAGTSILASGATTSVYSCGNFTTPVGAHAAYAALAGATHQLTGMNNAGASNLGSTGDYQNAHHNA